MFKRFILASTVLLALSASADDMVASNGTDSVHLTQKPCSSQVVLELVAPQLRSKFRDAVAMIGNRSFLACWTVESGMAYLIYEDGDQGLVPLTEFRRSPGV